jgi:hypothetical protein
MISIIGIKGLIQPKNRSDPKQAQKGCDRQKYGQCAFGEFIFNMLG